MQYGGEKIRSIYALNLKFDLIIEARPIRLEMFDGLAVKRMLPATKDSL